MENNFKARFDEAIRLKEASDLEAARKILLELHSRDTASPILLGVLGHVCWELRRIDEAIAFFQDAIALRPNSETLSLGLFHCFWESNRSDDAFDEMKRFLANNKSWEYEQLLVGLNAW